MPLSDAQTGEHPASTHAAGAQDPSGMPRHVAVIMDGNGRWAARRRRPRAIGHRAGARAVNVCIDYCLEQGIRALTLFAFSSENWGRPEEEVGALMKLFLAALDREVEELHRRGVEVRFIGDRSRFPADIRARMQAAETLTLGNARLTLAIAASYGGRQDIAAAARALAEDVAAGRLRPQGPGRRAAAGPVHPHRRRLRDQQLPAVAAGLHRAVVHAPAAAGPECGHPARGDPRVFPPRTPLRLDRRAGVRQRARIPTEPALTRTRVLTALLMAPLAIAAVLLLPTPWLVALTAILFLAALWEWFRLSDIEDTLQRTLLLLANLLLMAALVWASPTDSGGSLVLFKLVTMFGVIWWLVAMLWLRRYDFASDHDTHARVFKLAAGTLAVVPAWCALAVIHAGDPATTGLRLVPQGHVWLLTALMIGGTTAFGAYSAGRYFGGKWFSRRMAPRISPNKTFEGLIGGI